MNVARTDEIPDVLKNHNCWALVEDDLHDVKEQRAADFIHAPLCARLRERLAWEASYEHIDLARDPSPLCGSETFLGRILGDVAQWVVAPVAPVNR